MTLTKKGFRQVYTRSGGQKGEVEKVGAIELKKLRIL